MIALFLGTAGLYWKISWADEVHKSRPQREPKLATTPTTKAMPTPKAAIPNGVGLIANKTEQKAGQSQQKPRAIPHVDTAVKATPTPVLLPRADPVDEVALVKSPAAPGRFRSLGAAGGSSEKALAAGRELFERVWVKNDPRGHRGDGLGPVFNGQSCVGCHNLGGTGGAGGADRNIEIVTAADNVGEYAGYSYFMSMDFGAGKFEYRFGGDPPVVVAS